MKLEKYTKKQEAVVNAGMTLCVECPNGYYGDKSCGASGMQRLNLKDTSGCFRPKSEKQV
jgi:hypothetical protein